METGEKMQSTENGDIKKMTLPLNQASLLINGFNLMVERLVRQEDGHELLLSDGIDDVSDFLKQSKLDAPELANMANYTENIIEDVRETIRNLNSPLLWLQRHPLLEVLSHRSADHQMLDYAQRKKTLVELEKRCVHFLTVLRMTMRLCMMTAPENTVSDEDSPL